MDETRGSAEQSESTALDLVALLSDPDRNDIFAELRCAGPITHAKNAGGTPIEVVTTYEESKLVLGDPRFSNELPENLKHAFTAAFPEQIRPYLTQTLLTSDPPAHTRLRKYMSRAFTARRIRELVPVIRSIVDELLDDIDPSQTVDLVQSFTYPLPISVICAQVGIPSEDQHLWWEWSSTIATPQRSRESASRLVDYIFDLIRQRREEPGDDVISELVRVHEADSEKLDDQELTAVVILLVAAGHESTVQSLGKGLYTLLTHPDQLRLLRSDPSLAPSAVDELLRYSGSADVGGTPRIAKDDVRFGDTTIAAGSLVQPLICSANRDPDEFDEPERFDITREHNPHLGFGHGKHFCLGAKLARTEMEYALTELLRRFPDIALAVPPEEVPWRRYPPLGPMRLPVRMRPFAN